MLERLLDRHALERVERERAAKEIDRFGARVRVHGCEGARLLQRQSSQVIARSSGRDAEESASRALISGCGSVSASRGLSSLVGGRGTRNAQDKGQLVMVCSST